MIEHQRGVHDLGGLTGDAIDQSGHELTFFDKRVDALLRLLVESPRRHFAVDALRRAIEQLPEERYKSLSYYERWMDAIARLVVEQGLVSQEDLDRRIAEIKSRARADNEKVGD
jgi:hypothetical protein